MRRLILAFAVLPLLLAGCASVTDPTAGLGDLGRDLAAQSGGDPSTGSGQAGSAAEDKATLDSVADELVPASGPAARALRYCFLAAIAGEVWRQRVRLYPEGGDEASTALGGLLQIQASVASIEAAASGVWYETETALAVIVMGRAIEGVVRERSRGLVTAVVLRDIRALLRGARRAAGLGFIAVAMVRDVKAFWPRLALGEDGGGVGNQAAFTAGWAACRGRLEAAIAGLGGLVGMPAAPAIPQTFIGDDVLLE